jgi:hypothetical protein
LEVKRNVKTLNWLAHTTFTLTLIDFFFLL